MKKKSIYRDYLFVIGIIGEMLLASCNGDEWTAADDNVTSGGQAEDRLLVHHEVTVTLDDAASRVAYQPTTDGLQLSWEASETLGVYIRKSDNSYVYAGQMTSAGEEGDRGARKFEGTISAKANGEQYVYVHPAPAGETQGSPAQGSIALSSQTGALGSPDHLKHYIPLIWDEEDPFSTNHGYAVHLQLTFHEDPGTITSVTLRTMAGAGTTAIFPATFDASTMSAGPTSSNLSEITLAVSPTTARQSGSQWTAEVYLASTHPSGSVDVFRTKYDVKVVASNGTFYNEFRSFPGQESIPSDASDKTLSMLTNGKCYNLAAPMSKDVATTLINSQYKVNSLLGMWNEYGKVTDPFSLSLSPSALSSCAAQQLADILGTEEKRTTFTSRTLVNKSSQGTPTFTWEMVTKQVAGNADGYKQADVTYNNIDIIDAPTEVYVTFISEYAWSQNLLGYYHYPTGEVPASSNDVQKTIIFPNVSKGGHVPYNKGGSENIANVNPNTDAANVGMAVNAPLTEYTTVQLLYNAPDGSVSKMFPVGMTIGFFMMRDPKASSSGQDEGTLGDTSDNPHTGYTPRTDNTLLDWNSWRLFTNTAWNGASGNVGWWNMNCQNFFCSADVGSDGSDNLIPGLALYGAKDDASHNYNYSFSAMLFMVSTSNPASMQTANKAYFNLGTGNQIIGKP